MGSNWFLCHVTTGDRIILPNGECTLGRHSRCRIVLHGYSYVSREHLKSIVNGNTVELEMLSALNGVFINERRLSQQINRMQVIAGSVISLGVEPPYSKVPADHPVFKLMCMQVPDQPLDLSSSDDDTMPLPPSRKPLAPDDPVEFNLRQQLGEVAPVVEQPTNTALHLPKLPEMKQELVEQTSSAIKNIFGEANDDILGSVLQLNPYVFNKLNGTKSAVATNTLKIKDGDSIDLVSEKSLGKQPQEEEAHEAAHEEAHEEAHDEFNEQFALSQAVLQEIKADMDFGSDDGEFQDEVETNYNGSPSSQLGADEIIYIDSDGDDELNDKVENWSKKLLSQKPPTEYPMSQAFPITHNSGSEQQEEGKSSGESSPEIGFRKTKRFKRLRIDSSSEDEDTTHGVHRFGITSCSVRPLVIKIKNIKDSVSSTDGDSSLFSRRPKEPVPEASISETDEATDKNSLEVKEPRTKSSSTRQRKTAILREDIDTDKPSTPKDTKRTETPNKPKLRNRAKSCCVELSTQPLSFKEKIALNRPEESAEKKTLKQQTIKKLSVQNPKSEATKDVEQAKESVANKSTIRQRRMTISAREDLTSHTSKGKNNDSCGLYKSEEPQELFSKISSKLQRRKTICSREDLTTSKSENKNAPKDVEPLNESALTKRSMPQRRKTINCREDLQDNKSVKEPPKSNKQRVISRQGLIEQIKQMKEKWIQKPKEKNKETEKVKEMRREALKKLSDKPKEDEGTGAGSGSGSKRKHATTVPAVKNTNRGEFLTKELDEPAAKKAKKNVPKPPTMPKTPIPKRRNTIESFSQQLQAADEDFRNPQPLCSRPRERKDAEAARNRRTCNRVNFADMERYHQFQENQNKKRVRFNPNVEIFYIERVTGAAKSTKGCKESDMLILNSYGERREWDRKTRNSILNNGNHRRSVIEWGNQWLEHRSVDAVASLDVLIPVPQEFDGFDQYKDIFVPLMKLEFLSTVEREYNCVKNSFTASLVNVYSEDPWLNVIIRVSSRPVGRFSLYTLMSGKELPETFAMLMSQKSVGGGQSHDMTFNLLKQKTSLEAIKRIKTFTVRPVIDCLRIELGALSAVHQLSCSPLCESIMKPTKAITPFQMPKTGRAFAYKGYHRLNQHQMDIVLKTYQRVIDPHPSLTLIQGPPGTGKSLVISNLSLQCLYGCAAKMLDRKILICGHSNTAVDRIMWSLGSVHRLMEKERFNLLRFGMHEKMSEQSRRFSLEELFRRAKEEKLKLLTPDKKAELKKQLAEVKDEIKALKAKENLAGSYLQQELQQKEQRLLTIAGQLNPPITPREEYEISKQAVSRANIVCTTLSSCVKLANFVDYFDVCIIDEATQCTEPWTLLPMRFGLRHLVLVGDTKQLPAVVLSRKAIDFGLGNSMFDRIQRALQKELDNPGSHQFMTTKMFKLSMQYRMQPEICKWPNKYFYEDQLVNATCTERQAPLIPYCVINLGYTKDSTGCSNRSIKNDEEARFVGQLLSEMDKHMPSSRYSYGLISPYSSQCLALNNVIPSHMKLTASTIDAFQGLDKDVIIISYARTRGCGFLTNYQRLNVALTRPKRCLVICGNFADLECVDMWRNLLDDARKRNVYIDLRREHAYDVGLHLMPKMIAKKPIEKKA
ncbi:hypothetical protein KR018_002132 [Drosophila ironensis]|nr:hypothetical protein KR018_002132 [Drosophila ironensis]